MNLLRSITDLVDKDIAANSPRPLSLIGMAVPFLPFMFFVRGAPADQYPILSALALATSFAWGAFVIWRGVCHLSRQRRGNGKPFGLGRSYVIVIGTIVFILVWATGDSWLSSKIGWPQAYGFQCYGRGCWMKDLAHSPALLAGGSAYELALFALLWTIPACGMATLIYVFTRFMHRRRKDLISSTQNRRR
jgi:hypothetical protein